MWKRYVILVQRASRHPLRRYPSGNRLKPINDHCWSSVVKDLVNLSFFKAFIEEYHFEKILVQTLLVYDLLTCQVFFFGAPAGASLT